MFMAKLLGDFVGLFLYMICIFICWTFASNVQGEASCRKSDMDALMSLKTGFQDPHNMLWSWKGSNCCEWPGIRCNNISLSVTSVDLSGCGLSGDISSSLTKLESLTYLDLSYNSFNYSPIPEFFGSLRKLRYLNLSRAGFGGMLSPRLGNLSNLEYLDLSASYPSSLSVASLQWLTSFRSLKHLAFDWVDMSKTGSNWLEDINKLSQLKVLRMSNCRLTGSVSFLSTVNLTSLSLIDFSYNNFFSKLPNWILNVSSIVHVDMCIASLYGRIPLGLAELPNLEHLNLGSNRNLSASSYSLLKGSWPSIKILRLPLIKLHGKLPSKIGNMTTLVELYLQFNEIEGGIPSSIGKLCNLRVLSVAYNNLTENLPESVADGCSFGGPLPNLRYLDLNNNKLKGNLPAWLGQLTNLESLSLSHNSLQGQIPSSIGSLARLGYLDLSNNKLNGTVSGTIGQLSKLNELKLSSNNLSFKVGSNWLPSFQLSSLGLSSCRLETTFPTWLKSQKQLRTLDLSNNNISGIVPSWFWDDIAVNLSWLNMSFNQLQGHLPNPLPSFETADIDLSSNLFRGPISLPTVEIRSLFLSNNRFTGHIPANVGEKQSRMVFISLSNNVLSGEIPVSIGLMSQLELLDLANNNLSGTIPSNISNFAHLLVLDLSNNSLSGSIPTGVWKSRFLSSIHLNKNRLSGSIPPNIKSLSNLTILDLSYNELHGEIPYWLGQCLKALQILNLRTNNFYGAIPPTISNLRSLHVLDLAENKLTGNIPSSFSHLLGMSQPRPKDSGFNTGPYYQQMGEVLGGWFSHRTNNIYYQESQTINAKFILQKYTKILCLLTCIDLSCNRFSGPFPDGITNLSTLGFLNLSRNKIYGRIPESISRMRALESLDFSCNKLFGAIPTSISSLTFLAAFNVSNNNLSGKIPWSPQFNSFNQSAFEGNPKLCGPPLTIPCPGEQPSDETVGDNENRLFYMSVGVGFCVGLLFPILTFCCKKSWRMQYFKFVDMLINCILANRSNVCMCV